MSPSGHASTKLVGRNFYKPGKMTEDEMLQPGNHLEELKREIQKGLDSGASTPLDIEEIKARCRQRLAERQRTIIDE